MGTMSEVTRSGGGGIVKKKKSIATDVHRLDWFYSINTSLIQTTRIISGVIAFVA